MSPPPTSIDGTDITGATIDGQNVEEITIDGQTVFTAAADIPNNAVAQYDATQLTASDGDQIDPWPNEISGLNDLDADNSRTPTFDTSGINNTPSIDMTEDFFEVSLSLSEPFYYFTVYNNDDAGSERYIHFHHVGSAERFVMSERTDEWRIFSEGGDISGGSPDSNPHLVSYGVDGSDSFIRADGAQVASGTVSGDPSGSYQFGNNDFGRYADGYWGEIVIVEGSMTSGEISTEESRLANKWGLSI
jgi:hypothetical protein